MNDALRHNPADSGSPSTPDAQTLVTLKRMLLFTHEDEEYLLMAGNILLAHTEEILDAWYDHILKNNYLAHYFTKNGAPDADYLQRLRPHFRQWIIDLCNRGEGNDWWQLEERIVAQLHPGTGLDPVNELPSSYLRYLSTFIYPVAEAGRPFLGDSGYPPQTTARMQQAWFKAICFSVLLWIYPSARQFTYE
ncbi:protogloblin ApPgb [Chitinophaga polysaccharea]|uniref:protoglobin domain-containing protein n=1 Tax=Chitinophaga TaxID=79328 RepID=UPI0014557C2C|nr:MULTISPECIES: protoglobin domain-containing protein [Chitinophaga]NLR59604.1 protogloblin ApPgb [Chitinophaga polysaccharea]NLU93957.1 protogloblin ApPgb [Chitinophaga sp. Ak27]